MCAFLDFRGHYVSKLRFVFLYRTQRVFQEKPQWRISSSRLHAIHRLRAFSRDRIQESGPRSMRRQRRCLVHGMIQIFWWAKRTHPIFENVFGWSKSLQTRGLFAIENVKKANVARAKLALILMNVARNRTSALARRFPGCRDHAKVESFSFIYQRIPQRREYLHQSLGSLRREWDSCISYEYQSSQCKRRKSPRSPHLHSQS